MKKMIIPVVLLVLVIALAVAYKLVILDEKSDVLELSYQTNGGVPYKWEYEIEDESIVKFVKKYDVEESSEHLEGGVVTINYVFKGLKEGKTTITFKYVSIKDGTIIKQNVNTVRVDKNKNISLIGVK